MQSSYVSSNVYPNNIVGVIFSDNLNDVTSILGLEYKTPRLKVFSYFFRQPSLLFRCLKSIVPFSSDGRAPVWHFTENFLCSIPGNRDSSCEALFFA